MKATFKDPVIIKKINPVTLSYNFIRQTNFGYVNKKTEQISLINPAREECPEIVFECINTG